jgi:hypothetical protein
MRPYQLLPFPAPALFDPAKEQPDFFYQNFAKKLIPDMIKLMDTGLHIDKKAVEELRITIDKVLNSVKKVLEGSSLIKEFQLFQIPAAQKKWAEEATKSTRSYEYYLREYNDTNILHRTWVINTHLIEIEYPEKCKDKWTVADTKKLSVILQDSFLEALIEKKISKDFPIVKKGMLELAKHKAELWNRPREEKAKQPVVISPFNPGSNKQLKEFFAWLNVEPLEYSKKTNEASWGRDQIEELKSVTTDNELLKVLDAIIDFSYSAIIKNNFLKAFDSYTIDGVLHGNIRLFGAKSFRPTSNSPNLLNAPSTGSIYAKPLKKCFIAPKDFLVYTADLNGLEDRVIANLSGDENKQAVFLENLDGHSLASTYYFQEKVSKIIGKYVNNKEASKLLYSLVETGNNTAKAIRQDGKPVSFGLAYGAYPPKVAATIKCSLQEAERIFNIYHNELYTGITKYREEYVLKTAKEQGYIHLGLGCRMYTDDANSAIRTLANATVQFWSILTLIAINELNYRIQKEDLTKWIQVTSTIYDSIYTQVYRDPELIAWLNKNMIEVMTVPYLENQSIPNEAEGEIGNSWGNLYKVPNNATPDQIQNILYEEGL